MVETSPQTIMANLNSIGPVVIISSATSDAENTDMSPDLNRLPLLSAIFPPKTFAIGCSTRETEVFLLIPTRTIFNKSVEVKTISYMFVSCGKVTFISFTLLKNNKPLDVKFNNASSDIVSEDIETSSADTAERSCIISLKPVQGVVVFKAVVVVVGVAVVVDVVGRTVVDGLAVVEAVVVLAVVVRLVVVRLVVVFLVVVAGVGGVVVRGVIAFLVVRLLVVGLVVVRLVVVVFFVVIYLVVVGLVVVFLVVVVGGVVVRGVVVRFVVVRLVVVVLAVGGVVVRGVIAFLVVRLLVVGLVVVRLVVVRFVVVGLVVVVVDNVVVCLVVVGGVGIIQPLISIVNENVSLAYFLVIIISIDFAPISFV